MNAFVAMCEAIGSWHVSTQKPNSHLDCCAVTKSVHVVLTLL